MCVCWVFSYQLTRTKVISVVVAIAVAADDDCRRRRLECRHKDPLSKR